MLVKKLLFFTAILSFSIPPTAVAQFMVENKDFVDVLHHNKSGAQDSLLDVEVHKNYISLLPVVGYAPAYGFILGAAVSLSRLIDPRPTSLSSGMINAQVTSKKQFIMNARSKIYLRENKWFLQGDWRFLLFSQPTYGLGINEGAGSDALLTINGLHDVAETGGQDMRYTYFRIYEDAVRNIGRHWFLGLGFAYEYHYDINDQRLQLDTTQPDFFLTSHEYYSRYYGFNTKEYTTAGINFNVLTDTRDNVANPYKGYYAALTYRLNSTHLSSSQNSGMISYDARYYLPLDRYRKRHLLAFWSWGQFVSSGNVPYLALPSIGWDTYNRSGRGYIQGRFRGPQMVYNEIEYRFPITNDGFLGGVAFVNATNASRPAMGLDSGQKLFAKTALAAGFGFRMKMDKRARVNLTVDIGFGKNSKGVFFNLQEVF
jgi:hypothetical protein